MKIRRLGVVSMSKIFAVIYGGFGVLVGLGIGGAIAIRQPAGLEGVHVAIAAVSAIIIVPFAYAVLGFVAGAIAAVLFNLTANITGGLEMEVVEKEARSGS